MGVYIYGFNLKCIFSPRDVLKLLIGDIKRPLRDNFAHLSECYMSHSFSNSTFHYEVPSALAYHHRNVIVRGLWRGKEGKERTQADIFPSQVRDIFI